MCNKTPHCQIKFLKGQIWNSFCEDEKMYDIYKDTCNNTLIILRYNFLKSEIKLKEELQLQRKVIGKGQKKGGQQKWREEKIPVRETSVRGNSKVYNPT